MSKGSNLVGKVFFLDTNVFLEDPECFKKFGDENVVAVPQCVLEELESFKTEMNLRGFIARQALRNLEHLVREWKARESATVHFLGDDIDGIRAEGYFDNTSAVFLVNDQIVRRHFNTNKADSILCYLTTMTSFLRNGVSHRPVLVTKDVSLRLIATSMGGHCEDYKNSHVMETSLYDAPRVINIAATEDRINAVFTDEFVYNKNFIEGVFKLTKEEIEEFGLIENECVVCSLDASGVIVDFCARYSNGSLRPNKYSSKSKDVSTIYPRNHEQEMLVEAILDPNISLITVSGRAGCGKTLLSVAAAFELILNTKKSDYKKLVVTRPVVPVGNDIGFLPGTVDEKLDPWMAPVKDAVELIFSGKNSSLKSQDLKDFKFIEYQAISHVRGRSLNNVILLIDEAQNATRHEIKTLISRIGKKAKVIVTGDPWQIDNNQLDLYSNGLAHVISRMKGQPFHVNINMVNSERSPLSDAASKLL